MERQLDTGPKECWQPDFFLIFLNPPGGSPDRAEAKSIPRHWSSACGPHQFGPRERLSARGGWWVGLVPNPFNAQKERRDKTGCCRSRRIKDFWILKEIVEVAPRLWQSDTSSTPTCPTAANTAAGMEKHFFFFFSCGSLNEITLASSCAAGSAMQFRATLLP